MVSRIDLTNASDEPLLALAQRRDQEAIATLYERYYDRIYRFTVARVRESADAEDLTQEVFLKMVDGLPAFRWQGAPFAAWLFRIARNVVIDFVRRRTREQAISAKELPLPAAADMESELERQTSRDELVQAMRRLTAAQQEVLALRFAAELSVSETARALGKREGTVKATQFQAVQALRRMLTGQ